MSLRAKLDPPPPLPGPALLRSDWLAGPLPSSPRAGGGAVLPSVAALPQVYSKPGPADPLQPQRSSLTLVESGTIRACFTVLGA